MCLITLLLMLDSFTSSNALPEADLVLARPCLPAVAGLLPVVMYRAFAARRSGTRDLVFLVVAGPGLA
jgi:hypothetical protein